MSKKDIERAKSLSLLTLTSQVIYLKPPNNSFRSNVSVRNISLAMSNMDIELDGAEQTASTEVNAASAAQEVNAASAAQDVDTSEEDSLIDYNDLDENGKLINKAEQKGLKQKH